MIDANQEHAGMAITNDGNDTPTDLVVDETTGRLLITISCDTDTTEPRSIDIDENQEYVALLLANDDATICPLLTNTDGTIYADIAME